MNKKELNLAQFSVYPMMLKGNPVSMVSYSNGKELRCLVINSYDFSMAFNSAVERNEVTEEQLQTIYDALVNDGFLVPNDVKED